MAPPSTGQAAALLLAHPNVQRLLDVIAQAEGTAGAPDPYRVAFGGGQLADLARHPHARKAFVQTDGRPNTTSAAGKYQIQGGTWDDVAGELGLRDFGPRSQDLAAVELMRRAGALDDAVRGDFHAALGKLGATWAALPSSMAPQPHRSATFIGRALGSDVYGAVPSPLPAPGVTYGDAALGPAVVQPEADTSPYRLRPPEMLLEAVPRDSAGIYGIDPLSLMDA